jgi:hypothetical protein
LAGVACTCGSFIKPDALVCPGRAEPSAMNHTRCSQSALRRTSRQPGRIVFTGSLLLSRSTLARFWASRFDVCVFLLSRCMRTRDASRGGGCSAVACKTLQRNPWHTRAEPRARASSRVARRARARSRVCCARVALRGPHLCATGAAAIIASLSRA